ncbi:MAG: LamG domain-containing protein, partial [Spirochaetia bacterium]|nr:LamG domain-containing protein [Spirochaetia bacterium]
WNHVVINVEKDGTKNLSTMYLNGRLVSTDNSIDYVNPFSSNLTFGSLDSGTGLNFTGLLDEVAIYSRPLSEKEVLQNYSNSVFSYDNLGKYPISGLENDVLNSRYIQWRDNIIARENINSSISLTPILSEVEIIGETKGGGSLKSHTITPDTNLSNWGKIIVQTSDLYDNLVGYWDFDSLNINGSDFEVLDNSLNDNVGAVNGASFRDSGKINGALEFDGVNDYIEIPYDEILDFKEKNKITLSAWIYPESGAATWYSIISKGIGQQYAVTLNSVDRYLHFENHDLIGTGCYDLNTPTLEIGFNRWQHIVVVYDGEKKEIYINGQKKVESICSGILAENLESLFIGMDGNDEFFKGMIDEVRIYDSSLSE